MHYSRIRASKNSSRKIQASFVRSLDMFYASTGRRLPMKEAIRNSRASFHHADPEASFSSSSGMERYSDSASSQSRLCASNPRTWCGRCSGRGFWDSAKPMSRANWKSKEICRIFCASALSFGLTKTHTHYAKRYVSLPFYIKTLATPARSRKNAAYHYDLAQDSMTVP